MFNSKGRYVRQSQVEKFTRYSIRKVSFGAASVAVATGLFFLGGGSVQAAEQLTNSEHTEVQNPQNLTDKSSETSKEVTGQEFVTAKEPDGQNNTSVKESATDKQASEAETPNVVTEKVAINTASLEDLVAKAESRLSQLTEGKKTKSVIDDAKNLVNKAKELLNDDTKTQSKVDALAKQLSSSLIILNSIKSETTEEEKVNKNQDPRNEKEIPGKGESGFRTDSSNNDAATTSTTTTGTSDTITPTNPAQPTAKNIIGSTSTVSRENFTGWDTYTMPFGSRHPGQGDLGVNTPEKIADAADLEFRVFSDQRAGTRLSPGPSNYTYDGKESDVKARIDYGLKLPAEEVQKIIEEAPLWRGKLRYNGTSISSQIPATYYGSGPYEYLLSSIYKLGYEQGIDKVYIKDVSKRIEVTEAAKKAGWTVSDFNVSNFPNGLFYDKATDSVQGVVTHRSPFNYQQLKARVTFKNTVTGKSITVPLDDHRFGGTAWKDGTPPTLEINDTVKEGKVGEALTVPVEYRDAGASHAGVPNNRRVSYTLTNENGTPIGRTTTITETVGRAILGVSGAKITGTTGTGAATPTELTGNETKIPGVGFTIASDDMTENNPNGFKGTPTEAGIYRVSIYARDYQETNANEAYAHATFKIAPSVSVKNVHAYDTEVPITISKGASEATITLPDGTNTKIVAKDGKWVVSETTNTAVNVNDEIGTVGETFNLKVLPTATANAATDTINVTANSENITATFTRAEVTLKTQLGENVAATFNKTSGRWELSGETAEKKTPNSDGTTTWLKRDLYVDVNKDGETIFNVYEYTRTLNAEGKVTAVNNVSRTLTTYKKENTANSSADSATDTNKGMVVTVKYDKGLNKWSADDNSTVTATKTGDKWTISTTSGFKGTVDAVETASSSDKASILNDAPSISSSLYTTVKGATVDLVKQKSAAVTITDTEDDATTAPNKKETTVTKVTLTSPSGTVTEYSSAAEAATVKLSEVGTYTVKVEVKDSNGNIVTADTETDTGTNKGAETAVNSTTYTITVKDQETNKLYTVEDDAVTNDQLKEKVNPTAVDGFTATKNDIADIPTTAKKAGQTLEVPATVTYTKGTETIPVETKVDVVVLPKVEPTGVTVLKDSTGLDEAVKAKAVEAATAVPTDKLPDGVIVRVKEVKAGTVPETTATGVQKPATAVVEYVKDGKVVATREVTVPVTVVGSTAKKLVVFEGDTVTKDDVKGAVTPGTDGTKGEPVIAEDITAKAGNKEATIPVTYDNGKLTETVKVPVTVLPKPEADEILVPKNGDKEKAKEKVLAQAEKAIADGTFTGKLPQGARVEIDKTATVTVPDLTDDTEVDVTVKYIVDDEEKTTTVKVPVTVVEGIPQIVPVDENNKQPDPEKSIDKTDYPEGSTFRYKTPDGQTSPIDVTTTGDKNVIVEVLDPQGNTIVEVPATVRVVDSTPQFVEANPAKKQPEAKDSVTPGEYPDGTTFEYKTPVDTTTAGEKDVTVVAKLNGQPIAEVPAKVVVVDPKTQYVVADPSKPQPDAAKSIDPEQYPEGTTFEYKTPVDTTTPGEKDVVVIAKDGNDTLVEVPTKVKVVQGYPQIVPVDEGKKQPSPEDSIDSNDYPDDATFEYKEEVDTSKPGDKKVTVVVKQGDKVLVEVPSTVRVVEGYPKYVPVDPAKKQPDPKENINPNDFPTGTTFEYKDNTPVDTTTPGDKPVTVVAKLNGQPIAEIPATIVVVEPKTQYVPVNAESDKKPKPQDSITPDDYPEGSTFEYKTPEGQTTPYDGTTPGEKDVTVVVKDSDGDTIVEVPAKIKVVQGKEQLTPVNAEDKDKPKAEDSITPSDYPEGSTFEYKVPEGQATPYDGSTPGDKPVTVVVKDKDGKVLVEVPATIKVVETKPTPIETPVTNTPLKEEDYIRGLNIPDGATAKVGDLPDLTTPGEKTPVKVTITLPNGKSYTVDIPVTVTPIKEIETPVTTEKLTPEDVLKQIKVPEGATTKVGDLPDLTTPGKKDLVKVTVTLPNGKVVTVDVPVNVTPVKEIETPVTTAKLTPEDILKQIKVPEGATSKVENIPDLTTPGKKDPVKVTITLPNGKVITVEVPVNVTPIKEIETPVTTAKLTPEDILKQIKVPEGATTKVGDLPDLTTPGKKDPVKVTVTLPNGKVVTVDVPVTVTPVKEIETPVTTTPLTPDDYTKGIKIPEGGKVTKVENIPDLTTPGKKDPVKVTVTLPNGKVVTVDVPVNVTPVKEIETPVTTTPLTQEDYTKGITIPEGGKVTKVENIPDLTTPGKKDPVKVTVELPNGKVVTVDVPVNVTPITPIETPVTTAKLTPEDILKQIKVPEGATTKVENIPDLTTPGKKDPVKVTITLPNGKVVTVEIPVNVTPIEDIVKKQGDPITAEDVEKHIPKGVKVISIGDKPTTDVPGERPSIPVEIELPNGIRVTMNIPVIVTSKVTPVVVQVGTPVTPEDVQKHIELPNGWKVTKVGEIPTTTTPGTKPVVPVEIELPDGRKITVDVPVIVTPTVRQIVVPQGTPITPDDVKGHIDLPKEPGWEIIEVGEIPTTIPAGVKPSVKVKIKVPTGEIIEVEVPIIVTPTVTPIVVEVGTPITEDEVKKHVDLPEGWKITKVGEIPTTNTPGDKPSVTVELELPDGRKVTVDVPVKVTPKSNHVNNQGNNGSSATHIVTRYQDGDGKEISPEENGSHGPKTLEGYEYIGTKTDKNGNVIHTYKKVVTSTRSEQPVSPVRPTDPDKPVVNPTQVSRTESKQVAETTISNDKKELPNTGTEDKAGLASLGLLGMLGAFGLVTRKKKED
ncbi:Rib/alpha-like domain-containing protein [Streptococcus bouchesdurhonensis]|uniref:Rib/alpha-like domain-containing protein n=1 Tax=Streptococcus bouchesdurhonensis TaxID=2954240 RepID=UPI0021C45D8E|nr:Rib/alpha-like domain-containing protein [Streptococcus bouchesdurhonensis]